MSKSWEEKYRDIFSRYYELNLDYVSLLNTEVGAIDELIRTLNYRRKRLIKIKHKSYAKKFGKNSLSEKINIYN